MNIGERINGSQLDQKVRDILDHMQQGTYDVGALESVKIFHNTQDHLQSPHTHYLGNATPFARMWTGIQKLGNRYTENGELIHKQKKGDDYYFFVTEDGQPTFNDKGQKISAKISSKDIEKYPRELLENHVYMIGDNSKAEYFQTPLSGIDNRITPQFGTLDNTYMKPPPGITSISTRTDGPVGALKYITITFVVHNHIEFERIIQPWFFQPGTTIGVDYGWSNMGSNFDHSDLYDPNHFLASDPGGTDLEEVLYGKGYEYNLEYSPGIMRSPKWMGNLSANLGVVSGYNAKIDDNNSFQCTLDIVSRNAALASKEINDENGLKYLFSNAMDDILARFFTASTIGDYNGGVEITDEKYFNALDQGANQKFAKDFFKSLNTNIRMEEAIENADGEVIYVEDLRELDEGFIPDFALSSGIFYSEFTSKEGGEDDTLYISYGLFEDLFLNQFLTPTVKEYPEANFNVYFNNKNSYLRFDEGFIDLQKADTQDGERTLNFLVPESWGDTYNARTSGRVRDQATDELLGEYSPKNFNSEGLYISYEQSEVKNDPLYGYGVKIFPLRDLFISVPFIQRTFNDSNSISVALQSIFNQISQQSGDIWNINMTTTRNDSYSILSFSDANLTHKELTAYEFDCTSHNSIVVNADLSFQIPKDQIQSAVAMRNLKTAQELNSKDFRELMSFMNLTPDGPEGTKVFFKSVPNLGDANLRADNKVGDEKDAIGKAVRSLSKLVTNTGGEETFDDNVTDSIKQAYQTYAKAVNQAGQVEGSANFIGPSLEEKITTEESDENKTVIEEKTVRDGIMKDMQKRLFDSVETKFQIKRFLPVELSLTIKGNNLLDVMDIITVNTLPSYIKDRTVFQIMGIENSISSENWTTTYKAVMRNKSKSPNFKGINKNDSTVIHQTEIVKTPKKTAEIMQDQPEDAAKGKGNLDDVIEAVVEATPAKHLGSAVGNGFKFVYDVTQMASTFKDDIANIEKNKKTNHLDLGKVSLYQDLAMGFALRDHFSNPQFVKSNSIVKEFDPSDNTSVQIEVLDKINTRNIIGMFIDNQSAVGVSDFKERLRLIDHPSDFIHQYAGVGNLNLAEQDLSSADLLSMDIPTVPASISVAFLEKNDILYKVEQTRGAPNVLTNFFIPKSILAEGVGILNFCQELINLYTRYYTVLITKVEPENLDEEQPQIEQEEETTSEELENAPIDNNAERNWEEPFIFDDKIDVDLEAIDMKPEHHFWLFQALTEIKNSVPELYQTVILDSVKKIRSVKSEMPDQETHPSFCRGTDWYMASRPTRVWDTFKLENALEPTKFKDSWSGRSYNVCLYEMIDLVLHESYHAYQHVNKVRLYGKAWKENTFDWETPCIEWTADTMELMFEAKKGNFKVAEHRHITRMIDEGRIIVAENKRNAAKNPPGKLNHADVDGDGDYDYDDVQIRNIQAAAGRNTYSTEGMTEEELMTVYEDAEIVEAILERGRFIGNTFAEYFDKIKFHFKTFVEHKNPGDKKSKVRDIDSMTDAEWNWWWINESKKGRFRTGPGVDQD